jgi:hypothetical protein
MKDLRFICEEWRNIPEFSGYDVSSLGRVRSTDRFSGKRRGLVKGKELVQTSNKRGYPEVRLFKDSKSTAKVVHRLVAKAFIPNDENKLQVNHIDGNKLNNKTSNLEWMNNSENQKHAYSLGLQPSRAGEGNGRSVLTDEKVTTIKELYNSGKTAKEVSEILEVSLYTVRAIIAGKTWKFNTTDILRRDERRKPTTK